MLIKQLKRLTAFIVVVIFLSWAQAGCGGGGAPLIPDPGDGIDPVDWNEPDPDGRDDPDIPDDGLPPPPSDHNLFGFAGIHFESGTNAYVVDRSPDIHYNLTNELSEPLCPDCIEIEMIENDEVNHVVKLLVTLRNPTNEAYYDIRGIMVTNETFVSIVNPDGYITLFDDGGEIEWNPYYAYCLENEDRKFEPDYASKRFWYIKYTPGESMDFTLVVEGSHPGHCEDVTRILSEISDDTYLTPWDQVGNMVLTVDDWQWDISAVHLHIPDLNIEVPFVEGELSQYTLDWDSIEYPVAGTYEFYAEAWSPNPDLLAVRQYGTITVHPDDEVFYEDLPTAYPFRGITPMRDYRSSHVGPGNLLKKEYKVTKITNRDWDDPYGHSLWASETSNWYFVYRHYSSWHTGGMYPSSGGRSGWKISRFSPGFNLSDIDDGGYCTVLFNGFLTSYKDTNSWHSSISGPGSPEMSSQTIAQYFIKYSLALEDIVKRGGKIGCSNSWWHLYDHPITSYDCIALSGDRILTIEDIVTGIDYYSLYPIEVINRVAIRDTSNLEVIIINEQLNLDMDEYSGLSAAPDGRIYIVNGDRLICTNWALEPLWVYQGNDILKPAMVNSLGLVFLVSEGEIMALSPYGEELWVHDFELKSDPASFQNGDLIFVTTNNELLRVDSVTGDIVWGTWLAYGGGIRNVIVDAEERIYFVGDEVYIFNSTGELIDSESLALLSPGYNSNIALAPNGTLAFIRSFSQYAFNTARYH